MNTNDQNGQSEKQNICASYFTHCSNLAPTLTTMQLCHCLTSPEAFIRLHPLEPQKALYYFFTCEIVLSKTCIHTLLCKIMWDLAVLTVRDNVVQNSHQFEGRYLHVLFENAYFKWVLICNPGLVLSACLIYCQLSCCSTHIAGNLLEEVLEMRIHITLTHFLLWGDRHIKVYATAISAPDFQICDILIWENIWE